MGAAPWSVPVDLSTPGAQLPSAPSVAVAPGSRAIIAWWRRDATLAPKRDVVQIRRRKTFTAPFVGPVTLSASTKNFEAQPDVAATAGGTALVGWTEEGSAVGLRVLPGDGTVVPVTTLAETGGRLDGRNLDVGIAPDGSAVAVWTRDPFPIGAGGGDRTVRISIRSAATGSWSAPADLSLPGADHPAVAVAADGTSIVVWERAGTIEAATGDPSGVFTGPLVLSAPASGARVPAVAVDAAGDAVVAWAQDAVMVSERSAGGAFGPPIAVSAAGGLPAVTNLGAPAVAVSDGGRAYVAWRRQTAGRFRIEAAVRPAGLGWTPPATLSPAATRNAGRPSLGASAAGHAVVAWSQPIGRSASAIRARALPKSGAAFGALESVSTAAGRGTAPSVGLDAKGRSVLAWREDPIAGSGRFFRAAIRFSPG